MPTDFIRYDLLVQDAMRCVVRKVLADAARSGLPGDHHFNIASAPMRPASSFRRLREHYPDEMTIILQHQFWDLGGRRRGVRGQPELPRKPELLTIPFDAITGFYDPSVQFGFKLEPRIAGRTRAGEADAARARARARSARHSPPPARRRSRSRASPRPAPKSAETPAKQPDKPNDGEAAKVVSIDAFRKK